MSITNNSTHKYTFTEPGCMICEHHSNTYPRYCHGFKKRKNPKRFTSKDPKTKTPRWCPRRLDPAAIRVYRFKDGRAEFMGRMSLGENDKSGLAYDHPYYLRYTLAFECRSKLTAKSFYESTKTEGREEIQGFALEYGDVIEVDNGLKAFAFVYRGQYTFKPAYFDSTKIDGTNYDKNGR